MRIAQIPDADQRVRFQRSRGDQFRRLYCIRPFIFQKTEESSSYLLRVPGDRADGFAAHVIERQALLPRLNVPYRDEACTATGHQNMRDLLVPIQTLDIVCAGRGAPKSVRVCDVVQVGDVELIRCEYHERD